MTWPRLGPQLWSPSQPLDRPTPSGLSAPTCWPMASSYPAWSYWSDAMVLDDYAMTKATTTVSNGATKNSSVCSTVIQSSVETVCGNSFWLVGLLMDQVPAYLGFSISFAVKWVCCCHRPCTSDVLLRSGKSGRTVAADRWRHQCHWEGPRGCWMVERRAEREDWHLSRQLR